MIDELLEPSDEEVLGSDDGTDTEDFDDAKKPLPRHQRQPSGSVDSQKTEEDDDEEEEEEEAGGWGSYKRDYYDADMMETEADAVEEEQEARRLQQKALSKMTEADYGFDEDDWLGNGKRADQDEDNEVVAIAE